MPKGKTDLTDQEETKAMPLEQQVPDKKVIIGANLSKEEESKLTETLMKNMDIFTWSASDLTGVSRDIIQHALDINPNMKPRKQQQRKIPEDRILAAKAEVQRLLDADVIKDRHGHCKGGAWIWLDLFHLGKGEQICNNCCRIFHKMDRGQAISHNNIGDGQKVLLAKHCVQIWCTLIAHSR
jgi:hypothetical protein